MSPNHQNCPNCGAFLGEVDPMEAAQALMEKRLPEDKKVLKPKIVVGMLNTEEAIKRANLSEEASEDHDD